MNKKLNIGFIGCGQIAQIMHIPYVHECENMFVYSLCNTSPLPLEFMRDRYNVPKERCFANYEDMLRDPNLNAVIICTHDHYDPVMKSIANKKHILVEKPIAFNVRQGKEMAQAAEDANVVLQVGYMKPYDPAFEYFLDKLKKIEKLSHVRMHNFSGDYSFVPKIYDLCENRLVKPEIDKLRAKSQAEAFYEQIQTDNPKYTNAYNSMLLGTSHDSVLLRAMFGNDISVRYADIADDGQILAILQTDKLRISWESHFIIDRMKWDENMFVYSPECELSLHFPSPYLKNAVTKVKINENEPETGANKDIDITVSFDECYRRQLTEFYDCINTGRKPRTDAWGAVRDIEIASDIIKLAIKNDK